MWSRLKLLHQDLKMFHLYWYTWLVDSLLEKDIMRAALELKPAALASSTPASRHEDSSSGGSGGTGEHGAVSEDLVSQAAEDGFLETIS